MLLLASTYSTTFVTITQVRLFMNNHIDSNLGIEARTAYSIFFVEPSYHKVGTFNIKGVLNITEEILWVKGIPKDSPKCGFANELCKDGTGKAWKLF